MEFYFDSTPLGGPADAACSAVKNRKYETPRITSVPIDSDISLALVSDSLPPYPQNALPRGFDW